MNNHQARKRLAEELQVSIFGRYQGKMAWLLSWFESCRKLNPKRWLALSIFKMQALTHSPS